MDPLIPLAWTLLFCISYVIPIAKSQGNKPNMDVSFRITGKQTGSSVSSSNQKNSEGGGGSHMIAPSENVVVRVLTDGQDEYNEDGLSCYACDYELDGKWCKEPTNRTLFNTARCPTKGHVCQVWHFFSNNAADDKNDGRGLTYYFNRGCSESCQAGCTSLDDMENRFVSCFSCCTDNLCNVDSKASSLLAASNSSHLLLSFVLVLLRRIWR